MRCRLLVESRILQVLQKFGKTGLGVKIQFLSDSVTTYLYSASGNVE